MGDIHLKMDQKIELMMGTLVIVYILAVWEGPLSHKRKPIPLKNTKMEKTYLSISVFRLGVGVTIKKIFTKINTLVEYIENQLKPSIDNRCRNFEKLILTKNL